MSELIFSVVVEEIKSAFEETISDADVIQLLYDGVADPAGITNSKGESIFVSKTTAHAIVNRKRRGGNPLTIIRKHSCDPKVINSIDDYFDKKIVLRMLPSSIDDLIYDLKKVIVNDDNISDTIKQNLLEKAKKETVASFLASVYLYSLTRDNRLPSTRKKAYENVTDGSEQLEEYKHKPLEKIVFGDSIGENENGYINALLHVYGQLEDNSSFSRKDLDSYPKYKEDFQKQRTNFYAAEAVRRGTRDIYNGREDQFSYLKDEIYEGVIDVWDEQYKNGQTRMRKVMTQACNTSVDGCWLSKETAWIGNLQRKGVCHFLVNDDRLNGWVRDDDG